MNECLKRVNGFLDVLEKVNRKSDGKEIVCFKDDAIINKVKEYVKLRDVIWELCKDLNEDFVYEQVYNCLIWLKEQLQSGLTVDEIWEQLYETIDTQVNVYTSDLTEWLNMSHKHVYYLTEALDQNPEDGFQLLAVAQFRAIEDVWNAVLDLVFYHD